MTRKAFARMLPICLLAWIVGAVLLFFVRLIPSSALAARAAESAALNYTEQRPELLPNVPVSLLDNYTDCLMLNICLSDSGSAFRDMLDCPLTMYGGEDATENFRRLAAGDPTGRTVDYARYWHGYQLLLRPLLLTMNLSSIRYLLMSLELALSAVLIGLLWTRGGARLALPWLAFWLSLYPPALFFSLQYAAVFCTAALSCLAILCLRERSDGALLLVFQLGGILTAYLDLLTYPLAALGCPLVLLFSLEAGRGADLRRRAGQMLGLCLAWGFGYASMWAGKWLLAALFTGAPAVSASLSTAAFRIAGQVEGLRISALGAIRRNLFFLGYKGLLLDFAVLLALWLALRVRRGGRRLPPGDAAALLVCALMPFVWYALLQNHSSIHAFFTFRDLSVTVYALFSLLFLTLGDDPRSARAGQ